MPHPRPAQTPFSSLYGALSSRNRDRHPGARPLSSPLVFSLVFTPHLVYPDNHSVRLRANESRKQSIGQDIRRYIATRRAPWNSQEHQSDIVIASTVVPTEDPLRFVAGGLSHF